MDVLTGEEGGDAACTTTVSRGRKPTVDGCSSASREAICVLLKKTDAYIREQERNRCMLLERTSWGQAGILLGQESFACCVSLW